MLKKKISIVILITFILICIAEGLCYATDFSVNNQNINSNVETNQLAEDSNTQSSEKDKGVGLIAVALSTGLACIGAGIAVAVVGSSAVGAISENPKLLGKTIIFAGLAEGIAIYGLIISIMILSKI